jgi:hypothetical protein
MIIPKGVEFIRKCAFFKTLNMGSFRFEPGINLKEIEEECFYHSAIKSLIIPKSVEFLRKRCFYKCYLLNTLMFENQSMMKEFEDESLFSAGLTSLNIPANVQKIGCGCCSGCRALTRLTFCGRVVVGENAFVSCGLKVVKMLEDSQIEYTFPTWCHIVSYTKTESL